MSSIGNRLSLGVCLTALLLSGQVAAAQDGAQPGASEIEADAAMPEAGGERRLGSIVVTAQKKEEVLQSAPLAVSAFDTESLELKQIEGPQQLQFSVPSLVFAQLTGYTQLSLRGIGSDLTVTAGEPTVASFQDGVYVGQLFTQAVPSFDLERIEVLRGPQGTLYGRNSTGGAINYITRLPEYDFGSNLAVTAGNYGRLVAEGGITGALVDDRVAGRLTVKHERRDGYRHNLFDGRDYDGNDLFSAQGSLLFDLTPDLRVILRADKTRQSVSSVQQFVDSLPLASGVTPQTPLGIFSLPAPVLAGIPGLLSPGDLALLGNGSIADYYGLTPPGQSGGDPRKSLDIWNDFPPKQVFDVKGLSGTVEYDIGNATLRSITAYRESEADIRYDGDGSSAALLNANPIFQSSKQFTQELTLSGEALSGKLDYVLGAFYFDDEAILKADLFLPAIGDQVALAGSLTNPSAPPAFDLSRPLIPNLLQLIADPVLGTTLYRPGVSPIGTLSFGADQKTKSAAIYLNGTYRLSDRLRASAGVRYTEDEKKAFRQLHSNFVPAAALCETNTSKSWGEVTGTGGLDYDLSSDTMVYGKVSRGYKAGGFNPAECTATFDPEFLWSYEAGFKSVFANNQALFNAAAFYYDFSDIQFTTYVNNSSSIRNAAAATLYGVEVEYVLRPDAFEGLQLDGSGSWIHSEYDDQWLADPTESAILNIGGNSLIRAPEWKLNFGAQYQADLDRLGELLFRGEASYTSEVFHDVFNGKAPGQAGTIQDGYWVSNARVVWRPADDRFEAQLFVENITDEIYAHSLVASSTTAAVVGQFSAPRTYGVRLSMKLGSAR
ncbi:TonB-dependent receptor [Hyphomonas polymorpha PS728]|uniref:TonB-dependent receptor n=1 Tax=Hyphomonas polymorpha PS728 TaxID=1280954 RepID=A0A062VGD8_9PROT|nr:TonB-dependent receptor [Hyphomonas polymorpha]KCZ97616.1 TonB-dependent receptor [Hyphomonas polymorpha PS728]